MVLLAIISISWVTGSLKYDTSEFPSITAVVKRSPPSFPKSMLDTVLLSVNNLYEKTSRKGPSKKLSKLKKNNGKNILNDIIMIGHFNINLLIPLTL